MIEVVLVAGATGSIGISSPSAEAADESTLVQQLRRRIAEMEKNLPIIYAGAAVAKTKGELALQFEKFA